MTAIGYANMYSGIQNPERELTEEESIKVKELVSQLKELYTGPTHPKLGFTGFSVWYKEEEFYVMSNFTFWCGIWSAEAQELKYYEDTVGLITYLEEILTPMVEKHRRDMQEIMSVHYENLFGISE